MSTEKDYLDIGKRAAKFDDALAITIYEKGLREFENSKSLFGELVNMCMITREVEKLKEWVDAWGHISGRDGYYHHLVALTHRLQGDYQTALGKYADAYAKSKDVKTLAEVCMLSFLLGKDDQCIAACQELNTSTKPLDYIYFLAQYIEASILDDPKVTAKMIEHFTPYKSKVAFRVFRNFSMRTHKVFRTLDNKQDFERATRASGVSFTRPKTYLFPEDGDGEITLPAGTWIEKPTAGRGGRQIRLLQEGEKTKLCPEILLQEYIANPLLIYGRKFHMRCHLVFPNLYDDKAYLYRDGVVRFAPSKMTGDLSDTSQFVTNTALYSVDEGQKTLFSNLENRLVWTLKELLFVLEKNGKENVFDEISNYVHGFVEVLRSKNGAFDQTKSDFKRALPIYLGLDLLLDADLNVHLLEMQELPSLEGLWPMEVFTNQFFADMFDLCQEQTQDPGNAAWSVV